MSVSSSSTILPAARYSLQSTARVRLATCVFISMLQATLNNTSLDIRLTFAEFLYLPYINRDNNCVMWDCKFI